MYIRTHIGMLQNPHWYVMTVPTHLCKKISPRPLRWRLAISAPAAEPPNTKEKWAFFCFKHLFTGQLHRERPEKS